MYRRSVWPGWIGEPVGEGFRLRSVATTDFWVAIDCSWRACGPLSGAALFTGPAGSRASIGVQLAALLAVFVASTLFVPVVGDWGRTCPPGGVARSRGT